MSEAPWTKPCRRLATPPQSRHVVVVVGQPLSTSVEGHRDAGLGRGLRSRQDTTAIPGTLGWTLFSLMLRIPGIDPRQKVHGGVVGRGVVVPPWCLHLGQRLVPVLPSQEEPEKPSAESGGAGGAWLWETERGLGSGQSLGQRKGAPSDRPSPSLGG